MADFPLILAGPIVRRVDSRSASVWLALSKPSTVDLDVYLGPVDTATALPALRAGGSAETLRLGENLHVVVATARLDEDAAPFLPGAFHAYDVRISPAGGASSVGLKELGLLKTQTGPNGFEQPALGYVEGFLPGFRPPPAVLSELRIAQGGCRKPHDGGADALPTLADFLDPRTLPRPESDYPVDLPPQMMFLTGDQIYADDVSLALLPILTPIGLELLGGTPEELPLLNGEVRPATLNAFPNGMRSSLVRGGDAYLTSTECDSHLLSFGEFCAMYLLIWSNALWPAKPSWPTPLAAHAPNWTPEQAPAIQACIAKKDSDELDALNEERREAFCKQLKPLDEFANGLGAVRQALANVATYMICDDHEVTDDWFLTLDWKIKVLGSPLGLQIVRNAMVAYAFFQGWGSDPAAFRVDGDNAGFLELAVDTLNGRKDLLPQLDEKLGLSQPFRPTIRWSYQLLDETWPFGVLVLDERTRRGYRSPLSPPARIAPVEMTLQVPNPLARAGREVLFVVAPAPVLGLAALEELIQPGYSRARNFGALFKGSSQDPCKPAPAGQRFTVGGAEADQEPWSQDPAAFEELLALLAPAGRIVFVSGDVHFAHGAEMTYWPSAASPARFVQFTSSALKNSGETWQLDLIRSFGFGQRLFRSGAPTARLGWSAAQPLPLAFPASAPLASYPPEVRARFRQTPVLLPARRWPGDVSYAREPDWVWSMKLLFDRRSEEDRADRPLLPPDLKGPDPIPLAKLPDVARYHLDALRRRGLSRQTVFAHNIGVISLPSPGGVLTATHTVYSPPIAAPETYEPLTIHQAVLGVDPSEAKPGLQ